MMQHRTTWDGTAQLSAAPGWPVSCNSVASKQAAVPPSAAPAAVWLYLSFPNGVFAGSMQGYAHLHASSKFIAPRQPCADTTASLLPDHSSCLSNTTTHSCRQSVVRGTSSILTCTQVYSPVTIHSPWPCTYTTNHTGCAACKL